MDIEKCKNCGRTFKRVLELPGIDYCSYECAETAVNEMGKIKNNPVKNREADKIGRS